MELHQIRYFCAVAETGSFTRAAEREGIAQPSLSQQIQKLEESIGSRLFDRLGRRVQLTIAGAALLPQAKAILRQCSEAYVTVNNLQEDAAGRLNVGVIPTILPYFLAPRLQDFLAAYPKVDLHLTEETTLRLIERLQTGDLDVALVSLPIANPDLVASELFREPLLLAVPRDHPLARCALVDLAEVGDERLLLLREGHCLRNEVLTTCTRARANFRAMFESDQLASLIALVRSGHGISLLPQLAAKQATGCKLVPLARQPVRSVGFIRSRTRPGKTLRTFLDWLRVQARGLDIPGR